VRQQKIDLNYSTTSGISRTGPALKRLIVCIFQVIRNVKKGKSKKDQQKYFLTSTDALGKRHF